MWRLGDPRPEKPPKHNLNSGSHKDTVKAIANRQEADQAASIPGAAKHSMSGAGNRHGDYSVARATHLDSFMFDSKGTAGSGVMLKGDEIAKCVEEARNQGKQPALAIEIGTPPKHTPSRWVMVPFDVFVRLLEE